MISNHLEDSPQPISARRYEKILDSFAARTGGNSSFFSDAATQTRTEAPILSIREAEIISVCAGVAGPVLCSYVLWILSRSIEMGLKRLYFISRDGEVLLEIARRLLPSFWPESGLELRYLLGSRRAWMLPSFVVSRQDLSPYILSLFHNSSLKIIFDRVALTRQDCEALLPKYGFTANDWERKFTPLELKSARALILDPEIQERIARRAEECKNDTLGYLAQEGLFADLPYGMVDMGWSGATKRALEQILSLRGKAPPPSFFFGRIVGTSQDDQSVLHSYHFNTEQSVGRERNLYGIIVVTEIFCASLSPGLERYQSENGGYKGVYRKSHTADLKEWGYDTMRGTILRFAEKLADAAPRMKAPAYLPVEAVDALLRAFWNRPTKEEATVWGQFPFEEDPSGSSSHRLVQPFRLVNFCRLLIFGRGFNEYSEWRGGLIATHSWFPRSLFVICLAGNEALRFFYRLVFRRKKK